MNKANNHNGIRGVGSQFDHYNRVISIGNVIIMKMRNLIVRKRNINRGKRERKIICRENIEEMC